MPDPADKSGNDWNIGKEVSEILSYPVFNTLKPVEIGFKSGLPHWAKTGDSTQLFKTSYFIGSAWHTAPLF